MESNSSNSDELSVFMMTINGGGENRVDRRMCRNSTANSDFREKEVTPWDLQFQIEGMAVVVPYLRARLKALAGAHGLASTFDLRSQSSSKLIHHRLRA